MARLWFGGKKSRISITSGPSWLFSTSKYAKTSFYNDIASISVEQSNKRHSKLPSIDGTASPGPSRGHWVGTHLDGSITEAIMAGRMAEINFGRVMKIYEYFPR